MKISKRDALMWFSFFAQLDEEEALMPRQQEIVLATLSQIELAQEKRIAELRTQIPGLQTRTLTESPPDRICYILTHKEPYPSDIPALTVFQSYLTTLLRDQPDLF